jgi:hypothetical protein
MGIGIEFFGIAGRASHYNHYNHGVLLGYILGGQKNGPQKYPEAANRVLAMPCFLRGRVVSQSASKVSCLL